MYRSRHKQVVIKIAFVLTEQGRLLHYADTVLRPVRSRDEYVSDDRQMVAVDIVCNLRSHWHRAVARQNVINPYMHSKTMKVF